MGELFSTSHASDTDSSTLSQEPELDSTAKLTHDCDESSSEAEGGSEICTIGKQCCRFENSTLGTAPSVSCVTASTCPSPCRAAMRQARDACKARAALTISPSGAPLTPPAVRNAKQRALRDAGHHRVKTLTTSTACQVLATVA